VYFQHFDVLKSVDTEITEFSFRTHLLPLDLIIVGMSMTKLQTVVHFLQVWYFCGSDVLDLGGIIIIIIIHILVKRRKA